jgi:hypothetical protein
MLENVKKGTNVELVQQLTTCIATDARLDITVVKAQAAWKTTSFASQGIIVLMDQVKLSLGKMNAWLVSSVQEAQQVILILMLHSRMMSTRWTNQIW